MTQKRKRIVIVEDNIDTVHSMKRLLEVMGHEVDYAINGYVALDVIRRFKPDMVILDIGLPGLSGFEVCRQVRADREVSHVRIVAHTAYEEHRQSAQECGFDAYYTKPLTQQDIVELFG